MGFYSHSQRVGPLFHMTLMGLDLSHFNGSKFSSHIYIFWKIRRTRKIMENTFFFVMENHKEQKTLNSKKENSF